MSSFLKSGKRKQKQKEIKKVKRHFKSFQKILDHLDIIAGKIILDDKEVSENNIKQIVAEYSDITIGELEKNVLLSKINDYNENHSKKDSE